MTTVGHWVAADAGGSGTTLVDRSAGGWDGTLSAGCTWETFASEAAVRCPSSDRVETSTSYPAVFQSPGQDSSGEWTVWFRGGFHSLATTRPAVIGRDMGGGQPVAALTYLVASSKLQMWQPNFQPLGDANTLVIDTIYVLVARKSRQGALITYRIYDAGGTLIDSAAVDDSSNCNPITGVPLCLGWGGGAFFNGDIAGVAWRVEDTAVDDDTIDAIAADVELAGTVPDPADEPEPDTALVGHWVSADSLGAGAVIPDRALGNDAYVHELGASPSSSQWGTMDNACVSWRTTPSAGSAGGAVAPALAAYDVTDFTLIVCGEMGGNHTFAWSHYGMAERFPPGCDGSIASGGPWWTFGLRNDGLGGINPKLRFRHSDGATVEGIESPALPVPKFVQIGTAAPGGSTMSSVYLCGVKRSGNTFTYFWKGAVFRRSTGLPIDPDTGDPAEIPDAVVIGTDTSTLVSGTVDAPLRLFGGYDIDSFGSAQDSSWAAMWNAALSDSDILALMDAGYPACGTLPPAGCDDDLTDDDIISFRWDAGDSQLVNRVVCEFDYDAAADSYDKMLIFSHDSSIARYGPRPELRIRSKGLTTANDADDFLEDRAREIFTRFGDAPPAVLQVECFYRKGIAWEVGDIICVSSAFIPNLQISGRGISEEQFELVDVRPQFGDRGKLVATLLDVEAVSDQPPLPVSITEPGATFEPLTTLGLFGNTFGTWT